MEERQKVYIRGVLGRGEEVIQALVDLGGVNEYGRTGDKPTAIYYIAENSHIQICSEPNTLYKKILESRREIKLGEPENRKGWGEAFSKNPNVENLWEGYIDEEIKLDEQTTENEDDFFTSFLKYLRETPDEQLLGDWNEYSYLDLIGPTIKEFMEQLNKPRELRKDVLYEHKCKESSSEYSHEGKYHITDFVRCKDCSTGEWYDAVEYCKQECTDKYVRAKQDFIDKFKEC